MKINEILLGDLFDVLPSFEDDAFDLIIADPPYNISINKDALTGSKFADIKKYKRINEEWDAIDNYQQFTFDWISLCKEKLKENGSIYICASYHCLGEILISLKKLDFKILNIIVWKKTNAMPNLTRRMFTHSNELIVFATKAETNWIFNYEDMKKINPDKQKSGEEKQMRDVWDLPLLQGEERIKGEDGKPLHPAQKPIELIRRCIIASSNKNDLILDLFSGTGTTSLVALMENRQFVGIEKEEKYFKAIKERLEKYKNQTRINNFFGGRINAN